MDLDTEVLGWVLNDYEAPQTIAADIGRELKKTITEQQVLASLKSLTAAGLVQAFAFDASKNAYRPATIGSIPDEKLWFMATEAGKTHESAG